MTVVFIALAVIVFVMSLPFLLGGLVVGSSARRARKLAKAALEQRLEAAGQPSPQRGAHVSHPVVAAPQQAQAPKQVVRMRVPGPSAAEADESAGRSPQR
jgi:hypothetical protein